MRVAALALAAVAAALPAQAQEFFRCTSPEGKVTYQQVPCAKSDESRTIDASPANPDVDLSQREKLLKQGEEAQRRLEERIRLEEEAARQRREAREREEARARKLEREAQEREAAREVYIPYWLPGHQPPPRPPAPPRPRPQPLPGQPGR